MLAKKVGKIVAETLVLAAINYMLRQWIPVVITKRVTTTTKRRKQ